MTIKPNAERCVSLYIKASLWHDVYQTWNWVIGSPGHHFDPVWDLSFSGFWKKCPKCKMHIWNAEMTKVIVRCLLLDWNHWMSVHAMNFYFYLWLGLFKILWPENTSSYISRHLEFIIEQGRWIPGSLGHKMWPTSISGQSINQSFLYWHMTKRICWHLIQNCNTRKVNRNLYTACGLRSFYRPSVLCDRAFVCHVDDAADCTAVSPSTGAGAVCAGRGLNCCWFF